MVAGLVVSLAVTAYEDISGLPTPTKYMQGAMQKQGCVGLTTIRSEVPTRRGRRRTPR
jgi:hypothetical protein